jgi:hypothetical protein
MVESMQDRAGKQIELQAQQQTQQANHQMAFGE